MKLTTKYVGFDVHQATTVTSALPKTCGAITRHAQRCRTFIGTAGLITQ